VPRLDPIRRALRVLCMVHELHKLGYQRLRIAPGMSPSGCHWRCSITLAGNILKSHGARLRDFHRDAAHYTTGQDNEYFGWEDAAEDTVQQLAARFLERFPEIARLAQGRDWPYAGWYVEMLGLAERGAFPIAYADWYVEPPGDCLPTTDRTDSDLPLPPGGEAEPEPSSCSGPERPGDPPGSPETGP
jgi:hypothetical protein